MMFAEMCMKREGAKLAERAKRVKPRGGVAYQVNALERFIRLRKVLCAATYSETS